MNSWTKFMTEKIKALNPKAEDWNVQPKATTEVVKTTESEKVSNEQN